MLCGTPLEGFPTIAPSNPTATQAPLPKFWQLTPFKGCRNGSFAGNTSQLDPPVMLTKTRFGPSPTAVQLLVPLTQLTACRDALGSTTARLHALPPSAVKMSFPLRSTATQSFVLEQLIATRKLVLRSGVDSVAVVKHEQLKLKNTLSTWALKS
jgi:hypothetical protein